MDGCVVVEGEGPGDAAVVLADADADADVGGVATVAVVSSLELACGVLLLPTVVSLVGCLRAYSILMCDDMLWSLHE